MASTASHLALLASQLTAQDNKVVVFLGAGFLGDLGGAYASWVGLLKALSCTTSPGTKAEFKRLSELSPDDAVFKRMAQLIEDDIGEEKMGRVAAELLDMPPAVYSEKAMTELLAQEQSGGAVSDRPTAAGIKRFRSRLAMLRLLPVRAIITTNFTDLSNGGGRILSLTDDGVEACLFELLRKPAQPQQVTEREVQLLRAISEGTAPPAWSSSDPMVIHIHGTCKDSCRDAVVTTSGYRNLLHKTPTYLPFVRSLLSTNTVLYCGYSHRDAYLVEVRSETLALFTAQRRGGSASGSSGLGTMSGGGASTGGDSFHTAPKRARVEGEGSASGSLKQALPEPLGFTIMELSEGENDASILDHYRRHEGLAVLAYANKQHEQCDALLKQLVQASSLPFRLANALEGKRLLVYDKMQNGFAELCVPLLSSLVVATVEDAGARAELIAQHERCCSMAKEYSLLYTHHKAAAAAQGQDSFLPPVRSCEEWPLGRGGSIVVEYGVRELFLRRMGEAGLPPLHTQLPFEAEQYTKSEAGEQTSSSSACGHQSLAQTQENRRQVRESMAHEWDRRFAALITFNGYRGPGKASYLDSTIAVVQALPVTERMPILVYAIDPQDPEALAFRRREARAKGVFSYDVTLAGVIGSLFSAFS